MDVSWMNFVNLYIPARLDTQVSDLYLEVEVESGLKICTKLYIIRTDDYIHITGLYR